jgi:hypothetical protein
MKLEIEISDAQASRLREHAKRLGLQPDELARAAVVDLLADRDADFDAALELVLSEAALAQSTQTFFKDSSRTHAS